MFVFEVWYDYVMSGMFYKDNVKYFVADDISNVVEYCEKESYEITRIEQLGRCEKIISGK